jgi:hypothetical protein
MIFFFIFFISSYIPVSRKMMKYERKIKTFAKIKEYESNLIGKKT